MEKILIIKLGAKGDVVRTLPILIALKEKYPLSKITWITKKSSEEILKTSPHINKILTIPIGTNEEFDILYNFDIEEEATELAKRINAKNKFGFYNDSGFVSCFNIGAEYYLNTLFDDFTKKNNKKTYQEMMFEIAELPYKKQFHQILLNEKDKEYGKNYLKDRNIDNKKLIGIHIGSSPRWPSKSWHEDKIEEFIKKSKEKGFEIILFGGPDETKRLDDFSKRLENKIKIYRNNPCNSDLEFMSLVDMCKYMVCADSFAIHIAIALKKPTIGLFFCTSPNEIESYELLKKIVSKNLYDFFPEKMDQYDENLVKSISAQDVLKEIESFESNKINVVNAIIKNNNTFLVIKRKEGLHKGLWAFPGGAIEEGEIMEKALKRELKEETGLELKEIIKKISEYIYEKDNLTTKGACFLATTNNFNAVPGEEVEEVKWVSFEEFEKLDCIPGIEEELLLTFQE